MDDGENVSRNRWAVNFMQIRYARGLLLNCRSSSSSKLYVTLDCRAAYIANISILSADERYTTKAGTTSPSLFEQCVGSFRSHRN